MVCSRRTILSKMHFKETCLEDLEAKVKLLCTLHGVNLGLLGSNSNITLPGEILPQGLRFIKPFLGAN